MYPSVRVATHFVASDLHQYKLGRYFTSTKYIYIQVYTCTTYPSRGKLVIEMQCSPSFSMFVILRRLPERMWGVTQ